MPILSAEPKQRKEGNGNQMEFCCLNSYYHDIMQQTYLSTTFVWCGVVSLARFVPEKGQLSYYSNLPDRTAQSSKQTTAGVVSSSSSINDWRRGDRQDKEEKRRKKKAKVYCDSALSVGEWENSRKITEFEKGGNIEMRGNNVFKNVY